ncbi:DUF4292 domain-containing protein [Tenacibaculum singaporense]|uniref:DUF4292 domain-containing protein n=1 Tax=Tenacibaculum singaporense TaxID=2358479 RepID=A0A3Q8RRD2_9FLAO|nr:DUF4292 domain-containing protein [Tenacibaculum singaporense]AZJ34453.1 DUF4292 domain-containing protein [Tenacibaculum singaporense]RSC94952.1 DUF4292 domain-containing protein [Tenacibaculum singaporense]
MKYTTLLLILFLGLTSCKSTKNVTGDVAIKELSARKVAKKHIATNFDKKTVDARLKVNYKNNKESLGFSVRMKIKKDEVIWLKGTKIISIFKAKITPTKVQFYSPYEKSYFDGDFMMLKKLLGTDINFKQLQSMLLGEALMDVKSERQEVQIQEKSYQLSPKKQPTLFDLFFYVNPKHFKLNKQLIVNSLKDQRLDISYPKYHKKNTTFFPEKINIRAKEKNKFTIIDITTRSVEYDTKLNVSFNIPNGYKEIQL